ncbi:MAG: hypothetical protein AB7O48_16370 [Cyclobacteriaceae bacterium]
MSIGVIDILFSVLILMTGHWVVDFTTLRFGLRPHRRLLIRLFYYHLVISLLFGVYVVVNGGDSVGYWTNHREYESSNFSIWNLFKSGTLFIRFLTYPFSYLMGLSFWSGCTLFSLVGFLGFIFFFLTVTRTVSYNPVIFGVGLFPAVLFLPNMHFWSGGVGKDTIMFLVLNVFVFALTSPLKNIPGLIFSFFVAFYVRPHIALLMVVAFGLSMITSLRGLGLFWRALFFTASVALFVILVPVVLDFIKVDEAEIALIDEISANRAQGLIREGVGSAIDISSYSVPVRMITFLFRPLFFDAPNALGFVVSFENLLYLALLSCFVNPKNWPVLFRLPTHLRASIFLFITASYFLSSTMSNLGLALRQKNMIMFMFVLVAVYLLNIGEKDRASFKNWKIRSAKTGDVFNEERI